MGYDKDYEGLLPEDFAHLTEEERQLLGGDADWTWCCWRRWEFIIFLTDRDVAKSQKRKRRNAKQKRG